MEKQLFFRAPTARLGKYHMGGYGRIRVDRVNYQQLCIVELKYQIKE